MTKTIIGIMGPGETAREEDLVRARDLGRRIAEKGWVLLTGGRAVGVMDEANRGATDAGGITLGILPGHDLTEMSPHVAIPVVTGLGHARNAINALSCHVVIACGMGPGTAAEASLAIKSSRPLILIGCGRTANAFFKQLGGAMIHIARTPAEAIRMAAHLLGQDS